jgi:hypothetical protein
MGLGKQANMTLPTMYVLSALTGIDTLTKSLDLPFQKYSIRRSTGWKS